MIKATTLGTLVLALCCLSSTSAVAQKPIREELFHVDSAPPPSSVAGMASEALAIIIAGYRGAARLIERKGSDDPRVPALKFTAYRFQVAEIVKLHQYLPVPGDEVEFELLGGDKEYPTYILRERDRDTDSLKPDHTYVLFLAWNSNRNELGLAWGSGGIYDITDGRVMSFHRSWRHHDGTPATTFLAAVRAALK